MSIQFICEQCQTNFVPTPGSKNKYCSRLCAQKAHKISMGLKGAQITSIHQESYLQNPIFCKQCSSLMPYKKRKSQFCSRSCSAIFTNKTRSYTPPKLVTVRLPPKKRHYSFSKKCPISGIIYTNKEEYLKQEWNIYPNGRLRTIKLLAQTFNITLGNPDAIPLLSLARESLDNLYHTENLSTLEIHKKLNMKCSPSHVANLLKTLGIERRKLDIAGSLAVQEGRTNLPQPLGHLYKTGYHIDTFGNSHFFRSSYELKYYKLLDDLAIAYQTESIKIAYFDSQVNRNRIAIPDILIDKVIIEIKSDYTYDRTNMVDKFKAYQTAGYELILSLEFRDYVIKAVDDLP